MILARPGVDAVRCMTRFVEGDDRKQIAPLHECIDDYVGTDNPVSSTVRLRSGGTQSTLPSVGLICSPPSASPHL